MNLFEKREPRLSKFKHRFGNYYGHLIDTDFLMGRDINEDYWLAPGKKPVVNIREAELYYELEIPLPGWKKEDVTIEIKDNILYIKGEKEEDVEEKGSQYILQEHRMDRFERAFQLASITDKDKVAANFKNGMLYIRLYHLPDAEKPKGKEVKIK